MSDWWHHFFHDPMRDNPWSLGAEILILLIPLIWLARTWYKTRPERKRAHEDERADS